MWSQSTVALYRRKGVYSVHYAHNRNSCFFLLNIKWKSVSGMTTHLHFCWIISPITYVSYVKWFKSNRTDKMISFRKGDNINFCCYDYPARYFCLLQSRWRTLFFVIQQLRDCILFQFWWSTDVKVLSH